MPKKKAWLAAVQKNPFELRHVPEPLKTEEMCLGAVKKTGLTLMYVPEGLKTVELCLAAILEGYRSYMYSTGGDFLRIFNHVPDRLRTNEVCLAAIRQYSYAFLYISAPQRTAEVCSLRSSGMEAYFRMCRTT